MKKLHFELLTRKLKISCFTFESLTRGKKKYFFSLRVINWIGKLLFFRFRVTNVKLINQKKSHRYFSSNVHEPLQIDTVPYISICLGVAQPCSKVRVAWIWSPTDGNLTGLCLGATSLLVPETFEFKVLVT